MSIFSQNKCKLYFTLIILCFLSTACSAPTVNSVDHQYSAKSEYCESLRRELGNSHASNYSSLKPNQNIDGFDNDKYQGEQQRLRVTRAYEKDCETQSAYNERTTIELNKK